MDNKLIQEYGQDILCYRIRTARQKIRMQYKDFHKQLIKLDREEDSLRKQNNNLGWEPLVPPFQRGWKRSFVLRDDVARSKQAEFFENILVKINTHDWSHRRDFKIKRRRMGRKRYVVKEQKLLTPWEWHFDTLKFSDAEKQMFFEVSRWNSGSRTYTNVYVFMEPWRFKLRVKPNMITQVRIVDGELQSKIKRLENYIERNDLRKQQARARSKWYQYRYGKDYERYSEKNPLLNKPLLRILDELKEQF